MLDRDFSGASVPGDELARAVGRAAAMSGIALVIELFDPSASSWQRVSASGAEDLLAIDLPEPIAGVQTRVHTIVHEGVAHTIRERCLLRRLEGGQLIAERSLSALEAIAEESTQIESTVASVVEQLGLHIYEAILHADGRVEPLIWAEGMLAALGFEIGAGPQDEIAWKLSIHPEDADRYAAWYTASTIAAGGPPEIEYRVADAASAWRTIHERIAPLGLEADGSIRVRGLISDVTAQRQLERRVDRVMQSLDVTVFEGVSYPDGYVETVAGGYLFEAFGFDRSDESYNAAWESHIHPHDRARYDIELGYVSLSPGRVAESEYRILDGRGGERIVHERMFVRDLLADGGLRVEGLIADVTERRASERRLEALSRSLNVHLFEGVQYPDHYEQRLASKGALELLGLDAWPDDYVEAWRERIHPDDLEGFLHAVSWENCLRGRPIIAEHRFRDGDGDERYLRHQVVPREQLADGGVRVEGIVIDVTEQRGTERRLQITLDSLDAALFHGLIDPDGNYHSISELGSQNRRWFGQPADGVSADDVWRAHIHPDDRAAYAAVDGPMPLTAGDTVTHEFRVIDNDGNVRFILEQITPGRVLDDGSVMVEGITLEVTKQRQALAQAQAIERRFEDVMSSIGLDLYAGFLRPDGSFDEEVAPANALASLGVDEAVGDTEQLWRDQVHPDDLDRYRAALSYARVRELRACSIEYRMVDRAGNPRRFGEHIFARADLPDGSMRVEGFVIDVTVQHEAEQKLFEVVEALGICIYAGTIGPDDVFTETRNSGIPDALMLGGEPPEGMSVDDYWKERVHPDDRAIYDRAYSYAELTDNPETNAEFRVIGYDGIERTLFGRNFRRRLLADGAYAVEGVLVDVTERASAARSANAAQQRLAEVVGSLDLWVYDGTSWPERGFVPRSSSPELYAMFGTDPLAPKPLSVMHERIHADDRARYLATFTHEAYRRLEPIVCEFRLIQPDGRERILLEQVFPRELSPDGGVRIEGFFLDVTERHEARETERRLSRVLESGVLLVTTFSLTERGREEQFRGPGMERFVGPDAPVDVDAWLLWERLVEPDDRARRADAWTTVAVGEAADVRYRVRGLDGRVRWVLEQLRPRPAAVGGMRVVDSIISDVTGAQEATEQLAAARDEAELRLRVDPLTGVSNRMHVVDELEVELDVARSAGGVPAVVLLDIDHFKRINDLYLHSAGDRVLCEVAARIAAACRPQDAFGRWGGEEFVVIIRDAPTGPALRQIASRIRDSIGGTLFDVQGEPIRITASAGVARADQGTATVTDVFDAADRALYTAKRAGRDQLRMSEQVDERELLADEPDVIRIAEAVSRSASAREGESELHCGLVARLSGEVGSALGLGPAAQLRCRLAGLMHDIGKMAIPDSILSKPGALTEEEWDVMRHHAPFGAEIVSRIAGLADTAPAVRHHHERWDGNGYPDRLAGEEIPIEARIIAAVDSFCAMTEDRVYRKAMPLAEAIAELVSCRGKQFDPAVADALIGVVGGELSVSLAA